MSRTADDLLRYHAKFMVADYVLHLFGFNFTKLDIDKSRSFAISTRDAQGGRRGAEAVRGRRHPPDRTRPASRTWSSAPRTRARC